MESPLQAQPYAAGNKNCDSSLKLKELFTLSKALTHSPVAGLLGNTMALPSNLGLPFSFRSRFRVAAGYSHIAIQVCPLGSPFGFTLSTYQSLGWGNPPLGMAHRPRVCLPTR
ncbi:hypothetical protein [Scytonema sp. NUACC21]